jgi:hypothetical protein
MTTTRKQLIEEEIESLQGELRFLIKQQPGFIMAGYSEWYNAAAQGEKNGWTLSVDNHWKLRLNKSGGTSITIDLSPDYTTATCTRSGEKSTKTNTTDLANYVKSHTD